MTDAGTARLDEIELLLRIIEGDLMLALTSLDSAKAEVADGLDANGT